MKCKYCGGDVTLNDHFCPHCGRVVDQAQRHQKEMQQYEAEFEQTKKEALNKIAVSGGGGTAVGIRLAAIVFLIVVLFWMALNLNSYTVNERREKRNALRNYDSYTEQIDTYLNDRDYVALSAFGEKHCLDYNDKYREYRKILYAANDYRNVYRGIMEVAFITKDTESLSYANDLGKYVNRFYETTGNPYLYDYENTDRIEETFGEMEDDLKILLRRYLGLTAGQTDSMGDLSEIQRSVLIEQALNKQLIRITGMDLSQMRKTELPQIGATDEEVK